MMKQKMSSFAINVKSKNLKGERVLMEKYAVIDQTI